MYNGGGFVDKSAVVGRDLARDKMISTILHKITTDSKSKDAVLHYFNTLSTSLSYGMQKFLEQTRMKDEDFVRIMRFVCDIASQQLPDNQMSIMKRGCTQMRVLNRQHVATIVARSFLCLHQDDGYTRGRYMPQCNFTEMFNVMKSTEVEKTKCIMDYFNQLEQSEYNEAFSKKNMIYERIHLSQHEIFTWDRLRTSNTRLCDFQVNASRPIEDTGPHYAKVDFANKYLGGGVLNTGCLQEEITFTICPELISGMVLMEAMDCNEAIIISGFDRYSRYSGYARNLKYDKKYDSSTNAYNWLIAIDAIDLRGNTSVQYEPGCMLRDVNKAYAGFKRFRQPRTLLPTMNNSHCEKQASPKASKIPPRSEFCQNYVTSEQSTYMTECQVNLQPIGHHHDSGTGGNEPTVGRAQPPTLYPCSIATGNWGCGAFGGDPQLKSILQWIAASEAGCKELLYCTVDHPDLGELKHVTEKLGKLETVGKLVTLLESHSQALRCGHRLFDFDFDWNDANNFTTNNNNNNKNAVLMGEAKPKGGKYTPVDAERPPTSCISECLIS